MRRKEYSTVKDIFNMFLDQKRLQRMTSATIVNYQRYYKLYDRIMKISDLPIKEFNNEYLNEWLRFLQESGLKPNTVKQYITSMRVFHDWLYEEGYLDTKPKHIYIKTEETIPRFYTLEEIEKLLRKPSVKDSFETYSTYVMICFLLGTGVRAATLIEIKLSDIDFEGRNITLRHLKNRTQVLIPLSDKLYFVIKQFLLEFIRDSEDSYLFCTRDEKQVTTTCLRGRLYRYCMERRVEFKDLHAFRHSYAQQYIRNGGSIEKLQKLLTHKSIQTTSYYANIFGKDLQVNYESTCPLDNILSPKQKIQRRK